MKKTKAEYDRVGDDVARQRKQHVTRRQRRRHSVLRAQKAVDYPGLAADFGGKPSRQHGDEAAREGQERHPQKPASALQVAAPAQKASKPGYREHDQAHSHHDAEREKGNDHRWTVFGRESLQPNLARGPIAGGDEAAEPWDFDRKEIS